VVADGETVVIGGLTRNEAQESESGIPFLKDIPILGNLFKYTKKSVAKKDLVIFVTPRIIRNYIGNVDLSEPTQEISGQKTSNNSSKPEPVPAGAVDPAPAPAAEPVAEAPEAAPVQAEPEVMTEEVVEETVEEAPAAPEAPAPEAAEGDWQ
jgi:Type II secretory pathway, component PulD